MPRPTLGLRQSMRNLLSGISSNNDKNNSTEKKNKNNCTDNSTTNAQNNSNNKTAVPPHNAPSQRRNCEDNTSPNVYFGEGMEDSDQLSRKMKRIIDFEAHKYHHSNGNKNDIPVSEPLKCTQLSAHPAHTRPTANADKANKHAPPPKPLPAAPKRLSPEPVPNNNNNNSGNGKKSPAVPQKPLPPPPQKQQLQAQQAPSLQIPPRSPKKPGPAVPPRPEELVQPTVEKQKERAVNNDNNKNDNIRSDSKAKKEEAGKGESDKKRKLRRDKPVLELKPEQPQQQQQQQQQQQEQPKPQQAQTKPTPTAPPKEVRKSEAPKLEPKQEATKPVVLPSAAPHKQPTNVPECRQPRMQLVTQPQKQPQQPAQSPPPEPQPAVTKKIHELEDTVSKLLNELQQERQQFQMIQKDVIVMKTLMEKQPQATAAATTAATAAAATAIKTTAANGNDALPVAKGQPQRPTILQRPPSSYTSECPPTRPISPKQAPKQQNSHSLRRTLAVALYDFNPEQIGDLPIIAGDVIVVLKKYNNGWWLAKLKVSTATNAKLGRIGRVPSNFVEELTEVPFKAVALANCQAEYRGDLEFEKGDVLNILYTEESPHWWLAEKCNEDSDDQAVQTDDCLPDYNRIIGWIPSPFVKPL